MQCQSEKFNLDENAVYLNGAYMSPLLKDSEEAGIEGLRKKRNPAQIHVSDFFTSIDTIRVLFAKLLNIEDEKRIVSIPSASYGLANVARNIPENGRNKIVLLDDQFPSNYYIWQRIASRRGMEVKIVSRPFINENWSDLFLNEIDEDTSVVSMSHIHWGDGTVFNIQKISTKARDVGALFVLDGTQSIGAFPYDQSVIKADAIIVSAYKWLLGPYAIGLAFYGERFDSGVPIEESWLNRIHSDDFQYLTNYQDSYRSGARRYEVGEAPDFIKMPMLRTSLEQLLQWTPEEIQIYCQSIVLPILDPLRNAGFIIAKNEDLAYHLFGIRLPQRLEMPDVKMALAERNIIVSYRQDAIRVSPNVYNTKEELNNLKNVLTAL